MTVDMFIAFGVWGFLMFFWGLAVGHRSKKGGNHDCE